MREEILFENAFFDVKKPGSSCTVAVLILGSALTFITYGTSEART
jgi:hypothetical protein